MNRAGVAQQVRQVTSPTLSVISAHHSTCPPSAPVPVGQCLVSCPIHPPYVCVRACMLHAQSRT